MEQNHAHQDSIKIICTIRYVADHAFKYKYWVAREEDKEKLVQELPYCKYPGYDVYRFDDDAIEELINNSGCWLDDAIHKKIRKTVCKLMIERLENEEPSYDTCIDLYGNRYT